MTSRPFRLDDRDRAELVCCLVARVEVVQGRRAALAELGEPTSDLDASLRRLRTLLDLFCD